MRRLSKSIWAYLSDQGVLETGGHNLQTSGPKFSPEITHYLKKKTAQVVVTCHCYLGLPVLAKVIKEPHSSSLQAGSGAVGAKEKGRILRLTLSSPLPKSSWS